MGIAALLCGIVRAESPESPLAGTWEAVSYHFEGEEHPMEGLLIFTDRHFAATVRFRVSGGALADLNATTGTYRTNGSEVIFVRQIAANIRTGDVERPVRYSTGEGQDEVAAYRIDADVLTILFPSKSRYVARRVPAASPSAASSPGAVDFGSRSEHGRR